MPLGLPTTDCHAVSKACIFTFTQQVAKGQCVSMWNEQGLRLVKMSVCVCVYVGECSCVCSCSRVCACVHV